MSSPHIEKISIVGYGEIGKSLHELYLEKNKYSVSISDKYLGIEEDISDADFMHICIPYSDDFVDVVKSYISKNNPKIVVINSTVKPGTTEKLGPNVCHSPNRGLHPNLKEGIKTFLKYIGANNNMAAKKLESHMGDLGIETYVCKDSKTSEYAKLLDTAYYGVCIAFHSEAMEICEKNNLDFEEVMTIYNKTYNSGYQLLGAENFTRPVLYPTKKIGGHCIVPNAKILLESYDSTSALNILKYS
jgi:UDP-N-acetyl-D-mannosaminuronate dehydrogenase